MSNDKTTLADVQPGGRVRLGDQAERARFEAFLSGNPLIALCADTAWEICQAALSAQPSPGGQQSAWMLPDDARIVGVIADNIERGKLDHPGFYRNTQLAEVLRRMLTAALAARQPVGEPVVVAHRYIQRYQSAEHSAWLSGDADETYVEAERQGLGRIERAYAAPPAKAVDLDAMCALLQRRIEQWRSHLPADPGAPGTREIETKGEHDYNNDVRIYREGIAVMEEVLSKIDSQAVGNG